MEISCCARDGSKSSKVKTTSQWIDQVHHRRDDWKHRGRMPDQTMKREQWLNKGRFHDQGGSEERRHRDLVKTVIKAEWNCAENAIVRC